MANTSQHLQKLRQAGLIVGRKEGQYVFYRLAGDEVVALIGALGHVGETYLAEVERIVRLYFAPKDDLEPIPAAELLERASKGLVTVVDVRPPEEFAAGHLPGAVNIPMHELEKRLGELPKRKEVVAYCRGPYCLMSYDAVHCCARKGSRRAASRTDCPSGEWPACPSKRPEWQRTARRHLQRGAGGGFRLRLRSKVAPASKPRQTPVAITPVTASIAAV